MKRLVKHWMSLCLLASVVQAVIIKQTTNFCLLRHAICYSKTTKHAIDHQFPNTFMHSPSHQRRRFSLRETRRTDLPRGRPASETSKCSPPLLSSSPSSSPELSYRLSSSIPKAQALLLLEPERTRNGVGVAHDKLALETRRGMTG